MDRIKEAISLAKVITTWASYYSENFDICSPDVHVQNLKNIKSHALEIVTLLQGGGDA